MLDWKRKIKGQYISLKTRGTLLYLAALEKFSSTRVSMAVTASILQKDEYSHLLNEQDRLPAKAFVGPYAGDQEDAIPHYEHFDIKIEEGIDEDYVQVQLPSGWSIKPRTTDNESLSPGLFDSQDRERGTIVCIPVEPGYRYIDLKRRFNFDARSGYNYETDTGTCLFIDFNDNDKNTKFRLECDYSILPELNHIESEIVSEANRVFQALAPHADDPSAYWGSDINLQERLKAELEKTLRAMDGKDICVSALTFS